MFIHTGYDNQNYITFDIYRNLILKIFACVLYLNRIFLPLLEILCRCDECWFDCSSFKYCSLCRTLKVVYFCYWTTTAGFDARFILDVQKRGFSFKKVLQKCFTDNLSIRDATALRILKFLKI